MKRRFAVLKAIEEITKEKGYPPTVREIGDRVGLKSSSATKGHLDRLKRDGFVTWEERQPRTIRVIEGKKIS